MTMQKRACSYSAVLLWCCLYVWQVQAQNCNPADLPWLQTLQTQACEPFSCAMGYYQAQYNGATIFYNGLNPMCADYPTVVYNCDGSILCESGGFTGGNCPPTLFDEMINVQQLPDPCNTGCIDPSLIDPLGVCPLIYAPVCGCNGVTYDNGCFAEKVGGVTSWTDGECGSLGCVDSSLIDVSVMCPDIYAPVCGCNGVTYSNECVAVNYGGVTAFTTGECNATACQAAFAISDTLGMFYFTDQSTSGSPIVEWKWVIGDTTKTTQNATYYAGISPVGILISACLTITTADGCTSNVCQSFSASSCYLYPSFTYSATGKTVYFTNTSTGLGGPDTYQWQFGDGVVSSLQNPVHIYADFATYNVCLTVDGLIQGCSSQMICQNIMLTPANGLDDPSEQAHQISVHPIPFTDVLHIDYQLLSTETIRLALYDLQGKLQSSMLVQQQTPGSHRVQLPNVAQLPAGIYVLQLQGDSFGYTQKVVKQP